MHMMIAISWFGKLNNKKKKTSKTVNENQVRKMPKFVEEKTYSTGHHFFFLFASFMRNYLITAFTWIQTARSNSSVNENQRNKASQKYNKTLTFIKQLNNRLQTTNS